MTSAIRHVLPPLGERKILGVLRSHSRRVSSGPPLALPALVCAGGYDTLSTTLSLGRGPSGPRNPLLTHSGFHCKAGFNKLRASRTGFPD